MTAQWKKDGFETGTLTGQSTGATFRTSAIVVDQKPLVTIQAYLDNTDAVGTLEIQGTNFSSDSATDDSDVRWITVPFEVSGVSQTSFSVSSGVDVDDAFVIYPAGFERYRVKYTRTSGGGSSQTFEFKVTAKRYS